MQNPRTAFNDDDPRRLWIAELGDQWQGPHVQAPAGSSNKTYDGKSPHTRMIDAFSSRPTGSDGDPRREMVAALPSEWKRNWEGDEQ